MRELGESKEMYLECILRLTKTNKVVRAVDLAQFMNFSRPSISRALLLLENDGLIIRDDKDYITLTENGLNIAEGVHERHKILTELFMFFGVDCDTAENDACKVEHVISDKTFIKIKEYLAKTL